MNTAQALVGCLMAFFVVDYYHGDDYRERVLRMALERNHELEQKMERLDPENQEMRRLLRFRIRK